MHREFPRQSLDKWFFLYCTRAYVSSFRLQWFLVWQRRWQLAHLCGVRTYCSTSWWCQSVSLIWGCSSDRLNFIIYLPMDVWGVPETLRFICYIFITTTCGVFKASYSSSKVLFDRVLMYRALLFWFIDKYSWTCTFSPAFPVRLSVLDEFKESDSLCLKHFIIILIIYIISFNRKYTC